VSRRTSKIVLAAVLLAALGLSAGPGRAEDSTFQCSATGGADFCTCKGAENCSTMRKSGACSSALICTVKNGVTSCTCTAALGSGTNGLRVTPPNKISHP
jgi:hypothetical protein